MWGRYLAHLIYRMWQDVISSYLINLIHFHFHYFLSGNQRISNMARRKSNILSVISEPSLPRPQSKMAWKIAQFWMIFPSKAPVSWTMLNPSKWFSTQGLKIFSDPRWPLKSADLRCHECEHPGVPPEVLWRRARHRSNCCLDRSW